MCGIVSAIAEHDVVPFLLDGLRQLEYRGYDSAGIATINGALQRVRSIGRVSDLAQRIKSEALTGEIGIAHTRWATHGAPSERNAHPHISSGISVVHNGIIENHEAIRSRLSTQGYCFVSDTDTEVIAHLVHANMQDSDNLRDAVQRTMKSLVGAYAIAVISDQQPEKLVVARQGAPLLLGIGDGQHFAASDAAALIKMTNRIVYLEDGDCAELMSSGISITDASGDKVKRPIHRSALRANAIELGNYRHYMQKEIFEQPIAVARTLEKISNAHSISPQIFGTNAEKILQGITNVTILACGTSYNAGMVARYWLEDIAGIPCAVEIASEYRYRNAAPAPGALIVTLSQSGETADTIAALQYAKSLPHHATMAICNVPESALVRATDLCFLTRAGPEIGVASTKAFTTQLTALILLTAVIAKFRGKLPVDREIDLLRDLRHLPKALSKALKLEPQIKQWAKKITRSAHAFFLGRGAHFPIATEGALKLKEVSYIHAEAYAAGELKHGPLALVTKDMPVIAMAPKDMVLEKLKSNLSEVRARGGEIYVLAERDTGITSGDGIHVINMPEHNGVLSPILHSIPLQLLAYHTALERNNDVDKPRNLAKSVTVE